MITSWIVEIMYYIFISIYTHDSNSNSYDYGNNYSIKKFYLNENSEVVLEDSITKENIIGSRMISGFIDENQNIYVIYLSSLKRISIDKYDISLA